jgi:high-affinity iron transporter
MRTKLLFAVQLLVIITLFTGLALARPALAEEPTVADHLRSLAHFAEEGQEAAEQGNVASMEAEYGEIHEAWETFEDEVREQNPTAYVELEGALDAVEESLQAQPLDPVVVRLAYEHLRDETNEFVEQFEGGTPVEAVAIQATPAELLSHLNAAYKEVEEGETAEAAEQPTYVIQGWPSVEGAIATKSQEAYTAIEVDLGRAKAALEAEPAKLNEAEAAIERLRENLAPFVSAQTYTMFDAAAIILREGLEALLVIVALLAFLNRSGNSDKQRWIWTGGALGILASLITALILQVIFSYTSSGQNREVIEGATGLIAAGLLFYVSYWLHSKASLRSWQSYIKTQTTKALAGGSMAGLGLLSFLAVFREGAETTIFYLGMASSISLENLLLGLGIGVVALAVIAFLILKVGLKLPLRPFFQVASLLVYYLGFKFLGSGIHALQVGGILPTSPVSSLPTLPFIGFYPSWETIIPQVLLLAGALLIALYLWVQDRRAQNMVAAADGATA